MGGSGKPTPDCGPAGFLTAVPVRSASALSASLFGPAEGPQTCARSVMSTPAFGRRHARVSRPRVVGTLLGLAAGITALTACNPPQPQRIITSAYTTGYTWFDNTPPGSGEISHPVLHAKAGGTGTYADPIT